MLYLKLLNDYDFISPLARDDEENKLASAWLKRVDLFRSLPQKILEEISARVTLKDFKTEETSNLYCFKKKFIIYSMSTRRTWIKFIYHI